MKSLSTRGAHWQFKKFQEPDRSTTVLRMAHTEMKTGDDDLRTSSCREVQEE